MTKRKKGDQCNCDRAHLRACACSEHIYIHIHTYPVTSANGLIYHKRAWVPRSARPPVRMFRHLVPASRCHHASLQISSYPSCTISSSSSIMTLNSSTSMSASSPCCPLFSPFTTSTGLPSPGITVSKSS